MKINAYQIEQIRKLVHAAQNFEAMQQQSECDSVHDGEECGAVHHFEVIDEGALSELQFLADAVEIDVLDAAPELPSEIEIAALEDQLAAFT